MGVGWAWRGVPNGGFEECFNGRFEEIGVEFYYEGGTVNLENPENFSRNLLDSIDSMRDWKLKAKIPN